MLPAHSGGMSAFSRLHPAGGAPEGQGLIVLIHLDPRSSAVDVPSGGSVPTLLPPHFTLHLPTHSPNTDCASQYVCVVRVALHRHTHNPSLSLSLSLYLFLSLSISLSIFLSLSFSIYLSLSFYLSLYIYIYKYISFSLNLSLCGPKI